MKKLFTLTLLFIFAAFLAKAQPGQWAWAANPTESNQPSGVNYRVATDKWGNSFAGGYFYSATITYGAFSFQNAVNDESTADALVVKYDNAGHVIWAHAAGGTGDDYVSGIATDTLGNVYVSGYYSSPSITFGTTTLINNDSGGTTDIFIVKYDNAGNFVWAKNLGGGEDDALENMSSDAAGNIYLAGYFYSTSLVVGPDTLMSYSQGNFDNILVAKYDANGNGLWGATGGGDDYYSAAVGVAVSPSGSVYAAGFFRTDTAYFGNDTLYNYNIDSTDDIVVIKYDANGNQVWVQQAGGTDVDEPVGIAASPDGSVYITGYYFSYTCAFGTDTIADSTNYYFGFLAKYDSLGNAQWANIDSGDISDVYGDDVTTDAAGNVYILGDYYAATLTIGQFSFGNTDPSGNTNDIFVAAYNAAGSPLWAQSYGGNYYDQPSCIRFDNFRDMYVAGYFNSSTLTFGTQVLQSYDDTVFSIAFLAQLGCLDTPSITQSVFELTSSLSPSYQWYLNDTVLAGQTAQTLTAVKNGSYYVTGGDCNLVSNAINVKGITGINGVDDNVSVLIYPNPANAQLVVQSDALAQANNIPLVFDMTGRQIDLPYNFEVGKFIFDTHALTAGMYTISTNIAGQLSSHKFVKTGE